jgi:ribosome-binding factor A
MMNETVAMVKYRFSLNAEIDQVTDDKVDHPVVQNLTLVIGIRLQDNRQHADIYFQGISL